VSAELAARLTAASAVRTDFERESHAYAMEGAAVPDWATWAQRLSIALAGLLDSGAADEAGEDDDGTEPYCTACGAFVGMFFGMTGWHHFRGDPAPGGRRVLYEAGHAAAVGWTVPPGRELSPADMTGIHGALDHAAAFLRDRAEQFCDDCSRHPAGACDAHVDDLDAADAYRALAVQLGGGAGMHWLEPGDTCPRATVTSDQGNVTVETERDDQSRSGVGLDGEPEFADLPEAGELAHRLLVIRNIVAEVLDGEHGDRQLALEQIGRVVVGDEL
jgi:hypothetical protein